MNKGAHTMKWIALIAVTMTAACASTDGIDHVQDRAAHDAYLEHIYTKYDVEYVDDCLTYEELVCEFE
jgi:hypothetical protein